MNNQSVNSQDDWACNVAHNQIPVTTYAICRCTGNARICPEIFLIVPAIQSWMPSIKLLYPLRVIVYPACLMRRSTHPPRVPQRVVHCFITQDQSRLLLAGRCPSSNNLLSSGWVISGFLLTQGHLTWIVPLCSWVLWKAAPQKATSWAAHDSCF